MFAFADLRAARHILQSHGTRRAVPAALELRDVVLRHPDGSGLGPIDLRVEEGTTLVVLGPSGGGKTTLLRLLLGLLHPQQGVVLFRGEDLTKLDPLAVRSPGPHHPRRPPTRSAPGLRGIAQDGSVGDARPRGGGALRGQGGGTPRRPARAGGIVRRAGAGAEGSIRGPIRPRFPRGGAVIALLVAAAAVQIGSKAFTESVILGEIAT